MGKVVSKEEVISFLNKADFGIILEHQKLNYNKVQDLSSQQTRKYWVNYIRQYDLEQLKSDFEYIKYLVDKGSADIAFPGLGINEIIEGVLEACEIERQAIEEINLLLPNVLSRIALDYVDYLNYLDNLAFFTEKLKRITEDTFLTKYFRVNEKYIGYNLDLSGKFYTSVPHPIEWEYAADDLEVFSTNHKPLYVSLEGVDMGDRPFLREPKEDKYDFLYDTNIFHLKNSKVWQQSPKEPLLGLPLISHLIKPSTSLEPLEGSQLIPPLGDNSEVMASDYLIVNLCELCIRVYNESSKWLPLWHTIEFTQRVTSQDVRENCVNIFKELSIKELEDALRYIKKTYKPFEHDFFSFPKLEEAFNINWLMENILQSCDNDSYDNLYIKPIIKENLPVSDGHISIILDYAGHIFKDCVQQTIENNLPFRYFNNVGYGLVRDTQYISILDKYLKDGVYYFNIRYNNKTLTVQAEGNYTIIPRGEEWETIGGNNFTISPKPLPVNIPHYIPIEDLTVVGGAEEGES